MGKRECSLLSLLLTLALANASSRIPAPSSSRLLRGFDLSPAEQRALLEAVPAESLQQGLSSAPLFVPPAPRQGIPEEVNCEATTWCDKTGICSTVCARGSVVPSPWQHWATAFQLGMARKQPLCYTQLLASHNSAITLADGYGNRDPVYSAYLRWLKTLGAATEMQTNNQWLSLTDQLNLGVRVLELDVHFVGGELRIAHCGGLHSASLNGVVTLINAVAKLLGRPELTWDAETLGCSPSLSSIAVSDMRLLGDALQEIAGWMQQPRNAQELLVLFFDDQPDLAKWNKVPELLEQLSTWFPKDSILTPSDASLLMEATRASGAPAPSIEELVGRGKRLVLLSATDYKEEMELLVFSNATMPALCPYDEAWMSQFTGFGSDGPDAGAGAGTGAGLSGKELGEDVCFVTRHGSHAKKPEAHVPLLDGRWKRMPSCELLYGPLDCHFRVGKNNEGLAMNTSALAEVTTCGLNFPAPDLLTPARAAAHIWSWAESHPPVELLAAAAARHTVTAALSPRLHELHAAAGCTYLDAADGRWRTGSCDEPAGAAAPGLGSVVACRSSGAEGQQQRAAAPEGASLQAPRLWLLAPRSGCPSPGGPDCCPAGSTHDIPHSAVENLLLRQALLAEKAGRALLPLVPPTYLPAWALAKAATT